MLVDSPVDYSFEEDAECFVEPVVVESAADSFAEQMADNSD